MRRQKTQRTKGADRSFGGGVGGGGGGGCLGFGVVGGGGGAGGKNGRAQDVNRTPSAWDPTKKFARRKRGEGNTGRVLEFTPLGGGFARGQVLGENSLIAETGEDLLLGGGKLLSHNVALKVGGENAKGGGGGP